MIRAANLIKSFSRKPATKLLIFGNPLLDINVRIKSDELLKKYNLESNGHREVSSKKMKDLISDAKVNSNELSLGGSGLNTARVLVTMGLKDLIYFGAIGRDKNGKLLKKLIQRSSVPSRLEIKPSTTGTCLCLSRAGDRSLISNIGAAMKLEQSFVEENLKSINLDPQLYYYIEGFFVPEKIHICRFLYEKFSQNPKSTFITNLNSPSIIKTFPSGLTWLAGKADVVVGNQSEFQALADVNGYKTMEDLITQLFNAYPSTRKKKTILVTDGANPVFFCRGNARGAVESDLVIVPRVNPSEIVDSVGAGDSFVSGFIHSRLNGMTTRDCIKLACVISAEVIRNRGCNLSKK